ncbi:hypothetical protein BDW62DRAFT_178407 [Aspergillus aurantiobrunneus]
MSYVSLLTPTALLRLVERKVMISSHAHLVQPPRGGMEALVIPLSLPAYLRHQPRRVLTRSFLIYVTWIVPSIIAAITMGDRTLNRAFYFWFDFVPSPSMENAWY